MEQGSISAPQCRGRLAPSPTGAQHVGNARTYLMAWLSARLQGGQVHLRIEDLDSPRVKSWSIDQAIEDLRWLGLDWEPAPADRADPERAGQSVPPGVWLQTQRGPIYHQFLEALGIAGRLYPCDCTRKDVEQAASAPHVGDHSVRYPDTCRQREFSPAVLPSGLSQGAAAEGVGPPRPFVWRFRCSDEETVFVDAVHGDQRARPHRDWGDFVIARSHGPVAYQLAVVVDDHAMQVTEVVRGDDLIPSTFWQLELYRALGWEPPRFCHVPLVVGPDGRRLAKRHGDTRLSEIRQRGVGPERLLGVLAHSCGWLAEPEPVTATDLLGRLGHRLATGEITSIWEPLPRDPLVLTPELWRFILGQ